MYRRAVTAPPLPAKVVKTLIFANFERQAFPFMKPIIKKPNIDVRMTNASRNAKEMAPGIQQIVRRSQRDHWGYQSQQQYWKPKGM